MISVFVDARCLQDADYNFRGIGYHVASLLRGKAHSDARSWRSIALVDSHLPALPRDYAALFSEVSLAWNPVLPPSGSVFLSASPMTHGPVKSLRFTGRGTALYAAAVVYDFIPLEREGYLSSVHTRIDYFSKLARLKHFDMYLPLSKHAGNKLQELLGISQQSIVVTGGCVRSSLYGHSRRSLKRLEPYVLTVGGSDRRKNTEVVVRAVSAIRQEKEHSLRLKIVGTYGEAYKSEL
ncbi:MAG: hypothetical protein WKF37_19930, partial [Bryobacteraceae bacterium]